MNTSIHQPDHLPYLGFFYKMAQSDRFIILDDVQFKKNNFQNRNRIIDRSSNIQWLTVPIKKHKLDTPINEVEIDYSKDWRRKYFETIKFSYSKYPHYVGFIDLIKDIFYKNHVSIADLNIDLIHFFVDILDIKVDFFLSSQMETSSFKTERLIELCKQTGTTKYISGMGGKEYLDENLFSENGLEISYINFDHPKYRDENFEKNLSIIDLLFTHGKDSTRFLD